MKTPRWKPFVSAVAIGFALTASVFVTPLRAEEVSAKDFPIVIFCKYEGIEHAYYFSRVGPEGIAIYITPDKLAGAVSLKGEARRIVGDQAGNCLNKTIDELRSAGQAVDLPR